MLLKTLCELNGASGSEKTVRDALRQMVEPYVDTLEIDKMGNLIATKKGRLGGPKVLLAAHMDEVGLMITDITPDGFLKFQPVGGLDARILISKPVKVGENLTGVIGAKAIHLQKDVERSKALSIDQLYIDIGARSKDEASKYVKLGDYVHFIAAFEPMGNGYLKGKAFDDRVGCAALVEILKKEYDFTIIAAFTVQEEVGLRGAKVAAYHTGPDFAIVVEGTTAVDILDRTENEWVTELGKGPACFLMDRATIYNPRLVEAVTNLALKQNIPLQMRCGANGGTDAGRIHLSKSGIPTITIGIPCRYIHSFTSVICEEDYINGIRLVDEILKAFPEQFLTASN